MFRLLSGGTITKLKFSVRVKVVQDDVGLLCFVILILMIGISS